MTVQVVEIDDVLPALVLRFADRDGVIWTGAGVSARSPDSTAGVLSGAAFKDLLSEKLAVSAEEAASRDLQDIASLFVQRFGRDALDEVLRRCYLTEIGTPPPFYSRIVELPPEVGTFVTTNYDPYLERALAQRDPVIVVRERHIGLVSRARPVVYKPHGDAADPSTCTITTQDYDRWAGVAPDASRVLGALLLQRAVVAVGYRAQDGHFRQLIVHLAQRSRSRGDGMLRLHVAIPTPAREHFAAYEGDEVELVVINATGEALLDRLIPELVFELQRREAERVRNVSESVAISEARQRLNFLLLSPVHGDGAEGHIEATEDARHALIKALIRQGRLYEAIQEMARLGHQSIERGAGSAAERYVNTLRFGLNILRDAGFTDAIRRNMLVHPVGIGWYAVPKGAEAEDLTALVGIREGSPLHPVPLIAELASRRDREPMGSTEFSALDRRHAALSAEMYLSQLKFAEAAGAFSRAGVGEENSDRRSEYEIRGWWALGMAGEATAAMEALDTSDYSPLSESLRWRAYGWLAAEHGSPANGIAAFERAAAASLAHVDLVGAAASYGGILWCLSLSPSLVLGDEAAAQRADATRRALIEHASRTAGAPRLSAVKAFLEQADRNIIREEWRAASRDTWSALRLGLGDLDPTAVDEAHERLAAIWTAVLKQAPSSADSYALAACVLMDAHTAHVSTTQKLGEALLEAVGEGTAPLERSELLAIIARRGHGASGLVGALRVVRSLLPLVEEGSANAIVADLLLRAADYPWSAAERTDPRRLAADILPDIAHRLSTANLARLRDAWFGMLFDTPLAHRQVVLIGLANTLYRGGAGDDKGEAMLAALLPSLEPLRQDGNALSALFAVIAMLARTASTETAADARRVMFETPHLGRWLAAERLVESGEVLDEELMREYLANTVERIRVLTVSADPNSISGFWHSDFGRLTDAAVSQLRDSELTAAAEAVAALVGHDAQHAMIRAPWMPFAWRLARGSRECRAMLSPAVLRLARGEFTTPAYPLWENGGHPLGEFYASKGNSGDLREWALKFFASLYPSASSQERSETLDLIQRAAHDNDVLVRVSAQRALAQLFEAVAQEATLDDGLDIALEACGDKERRVRETAKDALETRARARTGG